MRILGERTQPPDFTGSGGCRRISRDGDNSSVIQSACVARTHAEAIVHTGYKIIERSCT